MGMTPIEWCAREMAELDVTKSTDLIKLVALQGQVKLLFAPKEMSEAQRAACKHDFQLTRTGAMTAPPETSCPENYDDREWLCVHCGMESPDGRSIAEQRQEFADEIACDMEKTEREGA